MVGLSVVLEGYRDISTHKNNTTTNFSTDAGSTNYWQILNKSSMVIMKPTSPSTTPSSPFSRQKSPATVASASGFLDSCFLCKQKLLPGKDIYMYKGEWAFCSVDCRCKQIFMDEEESLKTKRRASACTTSSSSAASSRSKKTAARNQPNGFAY